MTFMVDAETKLQPYPSLEALRQGNEEFLGSLEDESRLSPEGRRANTALINDFIQRAVASGAVLDVPADRRAAQGMIDYWSASAYSSPTSSSTSGAALARADVMLKPCDAGLVGAIAKRGEAVIAAAGQKLQDLARRLLLPLLRLVRPIAKGGEAVI